MRLFIAEKPSLARAIEDVLGILKRHNGYYECNAGDPDREGAYLVNEVLEFANLPQEKWDKAERLLINDLNPKAVESALESIEPNSQHGHVQRRQIPLARGLVNGG